MPDHPSFSDNVLAYVLLVWAAPVIIGPAILVGQAVTWLRTGYWNPVPISAAFDYFDIPSPHTTWVGAQKVLDFMLDLPLSITSFLLWMAVVIFTVVKLEEERTRKARAK